MKSLGDKVKIARERLNLTMTELAEKAGFSQPYVSQIEKGERTPSARTIVKLAEILQVPGEFLLRDDVRTLPEYTAAEKFKNISKDAKVIGYFVAVDKAIQANISPEELESAIEFLRKHRK